MAKVELISIAALAAQIGCLWGQVEGPFELPERFRKHRFTQVLVTECSQGLGIEWQSSRPVRTYRIGRIAVHLSARLRVEGTDTSGAPWAVDVETKSGGCWLWRADLDRNGKEDLIMVTSDATSAGDSIATLIMIDDRGRPVPWQAPGHFDVEDGGLGNLVDLDGDGRAELLSLHVEGIDRGRARVTSITRYEIRDARLRRVDGQLAGEMFPVVQPKDAEVQEEPDLTNSVDAKNPGATIASLIPGRKENCGVQAPLTRSEEGALKVDRAAAEALGQGCYDGMALSDGRKLGLPEVVVLDRANGREIAILDTARLLIEAKMRRMVVQFAGRLCDDGCHPFFLWAAEESSPVGNHKRQ